MGYKVIALIGEAGSGKDTILKEVFLKSELVLHKIVNSTTRPPREGEVEGINYFFLPLEVYTDKLIHKEFFEVSHKHWFYGTTYEALSSDKINIGVFNPDSIKYMIGNEDLEIKVYYICASKKNRLLRYLNRETDPDVDEIIRRYLADKEDFFSFPFDYEILLNDNEEDLDIATRTIIETAKAWSLGKTV